MPLPTFQSSFDDDPRLDTSGRSEDVAVDEEGVEAENPAIAEPATESPAAEPDALVTPGEPEPPMAAAEVAGDEAPADEQPDENSTVQPDAPSGHEEPVVQAGVDTDHPLIPQRAQNYFDLPRGKPLKDSAVERNVARVACDQDTNTVDRIENEAAFMREAEAHLAIQQGARPDGTHPDWIKKPAVWPSFIDFPTKRDRDAIRVAEEKGKLDDAMKEKFNAHFQKLSEDMQKRARQLNKWILDENQKIFPDEKRTGLFRQPHIKKDTHRLLRERRKHDPEAYDDDGVNQYPASKDPFCDIKWAILLDPYASPDDPRFANVARWSHGMAQTHDGGMLRVDDDGMFTPYGNEGSEMSGALAVAEAVERGWTSINISGTEEFVKGAREAAIKAGLGAKITTRYGLLGRSKPEFIMPNPPKLPGVETTDDALKDAHNDLTGDGGKAAGPEDDIIDSGSSAPSGSGSRKLATPGLAASPAAPAIAVETPFDDDDAEARADEEVAARLRADEDRDNPFPTPA